MAAKGQQNRITLLTAAQIVLRELLTKYPEAFSQH